MEEPRDYQIRGIPVNALGKLWRFAEPFVKRALDHTFGELSCGDIESLCHDREMQLWMIVEGTKVVGAGTTQLVNYPRMRTCRIVTLAGSQFDEWMHLAHAHIEVWAVDQGCDAMECYVRKGFVPKLLGLDYKHRYSVVHKSLKE